MRHSVLPICAALVCTMIALVVWADDSSDETRRVQGVAATIMTPLKVPVYRFTKIGDGTTTHTAASTADTFSLQAGSNITITTTDLSGGIVMSIESTGGGGGSSTAWSYSGTPSDLITTTALAAGTSVRPHSNGLINLGESSFNWDNIYAIGDLTIEDIAATGSVAITSNLFAGGTIDSIGNITTDGDISATGTVYSGGSAVNTSTTIALGDLSSGAVGPGNMANADHGDITWAAGVASVDDGAVLLNEIGNPSASKTFTMSNKTLTFNMTNPAGGLNITASGAFTGDLFEVEQNTGNPGSDTHLIHLHANDPDVIPIHVTHAASHVVQAFIDDGAATMSIYSDKVATTSNTLEVTTGGGGMTVDGTAVNTSTTIALGDLALNSVTGAHIVDGTVDISDDTNLAAGSAGIDITGDTVALDVAPSAGSATLEESDDAVQVKYLSTYFGEGASGMTLSAAMITTVTGAIIDGDNVSQLVNDTGYITSTTIAIGDLASGAVGPTNIANADHGDVSWTGGAATVESAAGSFAITNNLFVGGTTDLTGNVTADGNITATGTLQGEHLASTDDAAITDALFVGGAIDAVGNFTTDGDISATGTVYSGGNAVNTSTTIALGDLAANSIVGSYINNNTIDGTKIALGSDAQGDVMYYNGTDWARLAAGTSGWFLKTQGAGANPVWAAASGSGASTDTKTLLPMQGGDLGDGPTLSWNSTGYSAYLLYDQDTDEDAYFQWQCPENWDSSTSVSIKLTYSMASATATSTVVWGVSIMAISDGVSADIDTSSFDTISTSSISVPTAGYPDMVIFTPADDNLAAGDLVFIRVYREAADVSDTATGDAELRMVELEFGKT